MNKYNILSRAEMKNVSGGRTELPGGGDGNPGDPDEGGDGDGGNGNYKCCWKNQPSNCSRCVPSYSTAKCPDAGAELKAC